MRHGLRPRVGNGRWEISVRFDLLWRWLRASMIFVYPSVVPMLHNLVAALTLAMPY